MDAARTNSLPFAKFLLYKFLVVKLGSGYAEPVRSRPIGPAGLLIGAAFRAGFGLGRHFCPAMRTDFRRRVQWEGWRQSRRATERTRKGEAPFGTGSPHSGVFLVGLKAQAHQDVVVRSALHVLYIIGKTGEGGKAEHGEHFDGRLLSADEFRFDFFQTDLPGNTNGLQHQRPGQAASAKFWMDQHTHPPDVPFPAAELL